MLLFMFPWEKRVRRTFTCPCFLPEVMVKLTRKTGGLSYFVMLIEISMHLD